MWQLGTATTGQQRGLLAPLAGNSHATQSLARPLSITHSVYIGHKTRAAHTKSPDSIHTIHSILALLGATLLGRLILARGMRQFPHRKANPHAIQDLCILCFKQDPCLCSTQEPGAPDSRSSNKSCIANFYDKPEHSARACRTIGTPGVGSIRSVAALNLAKRPMCRPLPSVKWPYLPSVKFLTRSERKGNFAAFGDRLCHAVSDPQIIGQGSADQPFIPRFICDFVRQVFMSDTPDRGLIAPYTRRGLWDWLCS